MQQEDLLLLHDALNQHFWGATGLRDEDALAAALARPLATFEALDLYPTALEKAAALVESLVKNHPFQEGNMRIAYVFMRLLLLEAGLDLQASEQERHDFMLAIATSQLEYEQIVGWLREHTAVVEAPFE